MNNFTLRKYMTPYSLLFPSFLIILIFKVYPIFVSLSGSLYKTGFGGETTFVGLMNYVQLFNDPTFWNSLLVTIKFNLIITPVQVILAVAMAIFLNKNTRTVRLARTLIYLPVAINMVVASTIWSLLLNPNSGLVNSVLAVFDIPRQSFLTSSSQALFTIIMISNWKGIAYWMMFLLAGLQNISDSVYEAGRIDGTNKFTEIFYITIPMLKNSFIFVLISDTIINLLMFVPMFMLTNGGPQDSTNVLMLEAYKSAFSYSNYGRSYAIITILLLLTFAVVGIQFKLLSENEVKVKHGKVMK